MLDVGNEVDLEGWRAGRGEGRERKREKREGFGSVVAVEGEIKVERKQARKEWRRARRGKVSCPAPSVCPRLKRRRTDPETHFSIYYSRKNKGRS